MSSGSILEHLKARGFVAQLSDETALADRLAKEPLTYYCGFDATADSLHVGSLVPLMAMAHLARAGHTPIALLGGGTTMVGDPSGKTEMRKMLTAEDIARNRQGIETQVRPFVAEAGERARVVDNGEWLLPLNYITFLREIGRHFSVNRMLAAEAYKARLERGLSFIEFNYQILQAYDFLVLRDRFGCVLQIGGDDQWGNMVAGIDLIRRVRHQESYALTFPLLTTATGAKMGKTAAGAVWLDAGRTRPYDLFQYFVNVDDRDVERFLKLLTFEPLERIAELARLEGAAKREAKRVLARAVTALLHGEDAAAQADDAAKAAFGGGASDEASIPAVSLPRAQVEAGLKVVDALVAAGLATSKSAARRLIEQGGVRVGDRKVAGIDDAVASEDENKLLHAGKKHLRRLLFTA